MCKEYWIDVEGYDGTLQISNFGRVKSYHKNKNGIILKCNIIKGGYKRVHVRYNGTDKKILVHRLVAEAFLPNQNNYPIINHKDENPSNNLVWVNDDGSVDLEKSNLEWCDNKYNINYGTAIQRKADKLSKEVEQYTMDGVFVRKFKSTKSVEKEIGVFSTSVAACCRGVNKSAGGFTWKYAS